MRGDEYRMGENERGRSIVILSHQATMGTGALGAWIHAEHPGENLSFIMFNMSTIKAKERRRR